MTDTKTCFVICPIGSAESDTRQWSDDIFLNLIEPTAREFGYSARRANDRSTPGEITAAVVKDVIEADLVVADLTFRNANVFYELAIRHIEGKPFILVAAVDTPIPFDISILNVVFIERSTFAEQARTKQELRGHFEAVRDGKASFDNPLIRYKRQISAEHLPPNPLSDRVDEIEQKIDAIAARVGKVVHTGGLRRLPKPSFAQFNSAVLDEAGKRLADILLRSKFKFVYNPVTGASKQMTFEPDGSIGEGRNNNEFRWKIQDGRLEIIQADGAIHSRFVLTHTNQSLQHTNDDDTLSLKNQYIERLGPRDDK